MLVSKPGPATMKAMKALKAMKTMKRRRLAQCTERQRANLEQIKWSVRHLKKDLAKTEKHKQKILRLLDKSAMALKKKRETYGLD